MSFEICGLRPNVELELWKSPEQISQPHISGLGLPWGTSALGRVEPLVRVDNGPWSRRTSNGCTGWRAAVPDLPGR